MTAPGAGAGGRQVAAGWRGRQPTGGANHPLTLPSPPGGGEDLGEGAPKSVEDGSRGSRRRQRFPRLCRVPMVFRTWSHQVGAM